MKYRYLLIFLVMALAAVVQSCSSSSDKPQSSIQKSTSAHEQVAEKIDGIVSDSKRADQAASIVEQMFEETETFLESVNESRKTAIELSENYDTTRKAFETHYEIFFQQRKVHSKKYTALSFQLRKAVTEDEWNKINEVLAKEMQKLSADSTEKG
jgi:superfamily II RNA helicase